MAVSTVIVVIMLSKAYRAQEGDDLPVFLRRFFVDVRPPRKRAKLRAIAVEMARSSNSMARWKREFPA